MKLKDEITKLAKQAKEASSLLAVTSGAQRNAALRLMAGYLDKGKSAILKANRKDVRQAKKTNRSAAFIDRLTLNEVRLKKMSDSLRKVAALPDVIGGIDRLRLRPNGLLVGKMRVPIGVIGIIYESRPDVTSDTAGLCLKSGNAVILKGGKESINSNLAIHGCLKRAIGKSGLPEASLNLIASLGRKAVDILLRQDRYVDLIIPRGGESLIRKIASQSRIPVIKHYKGVCHIYVDEEADLNMAEEIVFNAKVQRPGTCNAMETLLVHRDAAARFLPGALKKLQAAGVEIRGCELTRRIGKDIKKASEKDWGKEYLDLILSVRVVESFGEALAHITRYGSGLSEAIVTDNYQRGMDFLKKVDAAAVYVNASTRFTDGGEFGLGAEIGISTDKLHARGPMGLEELTSYKWVILGSGQTREMQS